MEFAFDINAILTEEITILNADLRILNRGQTSRAVASEKLTAIIDVLGEASYKAQGLPGPVTTARKFRISDHRLYILKNASDHHNLGSVVGLLKVGAKHLYVYDSHGQVHECTPLCLLDFYVHESKQRSGYGKKLFEAMLAFEKCQAHELAVDRPSNKCLGFLQKHYHLSAPVRQVNNFVVFNAFFNRGPILQNRRSSASRHSHQNNATVDNFRRAEGASWLLPSEKQPPPPLPPGRRPTSEQNDAYGNHRVRTVSDESNLLSHRRYASAIGGPSMINERKLSSDHLTPYGDSYNQKPPVNEPIRTNASSHSASHVPRSYTSLLNENNLQRYHTNVVISTHKEPPSSDPLQVYTYKDYQSSAINSVRSNAVAPPQPQPLTSLYTFPSLLKPNTHWRRSPQQQLPSQPPSDGSSSGWRLFGVRHVPN